MLWVCACGCGVRGAKGVPAVGEERSQWRMAPSEPPETRIGWTGCHASEQTSFLCPRRTTHSFIERMSNTRTVWSREALASRFPCGAHESACIVFLCWCSVVSEVPVRGSQNLMRLSLLPDTSRPIVGCHSTHLTSHPCPVSTRSSRLSANDHTRTVESSLAVANRASSGEKLSPRTASRCAGHAVRLFMFGWKYLTMPVWSADAM